MDVERVTKRAVCVKISFVQHIILCVSDAHVVSYQNIIVQLRGLEVSDQ